jgi:hypothetical protein
MAEGNSFTNLLKLMKTQGYNKDVQVTVGAVKSPKPLTIDIDGLVITEGDVIKSQTIQYLIDGMTGTIRNFSPSHTHSDKVDIDIVKLKAGDMVLILIDDNNFYIIDRVVG